MPGVDRLAARVPTAATLRQHLIDSHTTVEDVAVSPPRPGSRRSCCRTWCRPDDPLITDQMWIDAARPYFTARIVLARDGMEL